MTYSHLQTHVKDGIGTLVLNRPPLNVLNIEMMEEMNRALTSFRTEPIKLLVIKALGKAFSAGVDVSEHMGDLAEKMIVVFHDIFRNMDKLGAPSIALVNGSALGGGCELAFYCDMVVASEKAKFGQPEIQVGVFPPIAALILPRIMGRKKALEFMLSGDIITAQEAKEWGLVNLVVSVDSFEEEAEKFVNKFSGLSGVVMRLARKACLEGLRDKVDKGLEAIEDIYLKKLMKTADAQEGLQSFLDKRKPEWKER